MNRADSVQYSGLSEVLMSLYQDWKGDIESHSTTPEEQNIYWQEFCEAEQGVYKKILGEQRQVVEGTFKDLAEEFEMPQPWFMGFMDGISESLNESLGELRRLYGRFACQN